jgi:cob(I)alamin adenosyltransferase
MPKTKRGLIHVYTGDGKGKTTAALGLALRAAGHGLRTYVGQFMKGQEYGELRSAEMLGTDDRGRPFLTLVQFGKPTLLRKEEASQEDVEMARAGLEAALQAMRSGEYQIVVLDEVNVALYFELLTVQEVLAFLDQKPPEVELVLTGRRVPQEIVDRADYVTVMEEAKHPFQEGVKARKGIEF